MELFNQKSHITTILSENLIEKQGCGILGTDNEDTTCYIIGLNIPKCFETKSKLYDLIRNMCNKSLKVPLSFIDTVIFSNDFGMSLTVEKNNNKIEYFLGLGGSVNGFKLNETYLCNLSFAESILINKYIKMIDTAFQNGNYHMQQIS